MRREAKGKRVKQTLDVLIILCGAGAVFLVFKEIGTWRFAPAVYFVIVIGMAAAYMIFPAQRQQEYGRDHARGGKNTGDTKADSAG